MIETVKLTHIIFYMFLIALLKYNSHSIKLTYNATSPMTLINSHIGEVSLFSYLIEPFITNGSILFGVEEK